MIFEICVGRVFWEVKKEWWGDVRKENVEAPI
jgi:hypothetical protein